MFKGKKLSKDEAVRLVDKHATNAWFELSLTDSGSPYRVHQASVDLYKQLRGCHPNDDHDDADEKPLQNSFLKNNP